MRPTRRPTPRWASTKAGGRRPGSSRSLLRASPRTLDAKKARTLRSARASFAWSAQRSVAAVAVLRVGIILLVLLVLLVVARRAASAVDVDIADRAAIVGLALPAEVDLALAVVAVAGIGAARGDTADGQSAVRAPLD